MGEVGEGGGDERRGYEVRVVCSDGRDEVGECPVALCALNMKTKNLIPLILLSAHFTHRLLSYKAGLFSHYLHYSCILLRKTSFSHVSPSEQGSKLPHHLPFGHHPNHPKHETRISISLHFAYSPSVVSRKHPRTSFPPCASIPIYIHQSIYRAHVLLNLSC